MRSASGTRWFWVLLAGVGCEPEVATPRPPVATDSASPETKRAPKVECLRRKLPRRFEREHYTTVEAAFRDCLGHTGAEIAESGAHGLRFGVDAHTGHELEVRLVCSDVCPDYTSAGIAFVDVDELGECVCLGQQPLFAPGWEAYVGCAPARWPVVPHFREHYDFTLREEFRNGERTIAVFGVGVELEAAGLIQGAQVLAVDGHATQSSVDGRRALEQLPGNPPRSMRIRVGHGATGRATDRQIHYVARTTIEDLSESVSAIRRTYKDPHFCDEGPNVIVESSSVCASARSRDPAIQEWARLVTKIEKQAKQAPADSQRLTPVDCKAVSKLPSMIRVDHENRRLELRYVGWIRAGAPP